MNEQSKSVLFVCMGNICRSPAAEGVLRHIIEKNKLDFEVIVDSAGTIGFHEGKPADTRMQNAAAARGYRLDSRARKVKKDDLRTFDLIVAMDRENLAELTALADITSIAKIKLLGEFLHADGAPDVPDPYYGGPDGFETVLDMLESACPLILSCLENKHEN